MDGGFEVIDVADFPSYAELRRRPFVPPYPADTVVEERGLYTPEGVIEVNAVAVVRRRGHDGCILLAT